MTSFGGEVKVGALVALSFVILGLAVGEESSDSSSGFQVTATIDQNITPSRLQSFLILMSFTDGEGGGKK